MTLSGIIVVAGMSRRMHDFKPLLRINGFPMIQMTIQSMKNAGIDDIVVVAGNRADDIEAVLQPLQVRMVRNEHYATTDMFTSVKLGLQAISPDTDGTFIMPGDLPMIAPQTFHDLIQMADSMRDEITALVPMLAGKYAHPPLLLRKTIPAILAYDGPGGLHGAYMSQNPKTVDITDIGANLDADYRVDFERIQMFAKEYRGISAELCFELYEKVQLPEHIRRHCIAVGDLAAEMAQTLIRHGYCMDVELCRSGGYLHDICKLELQHPRVGADFVRSYGYSAVAMLVERHKGFDSIQVPEFDERVVVCLADKLIREDRRSTVEARYQPACDRFPSDTPVGNRIRTDLLICQQLCKKYQKLTGVDLNAAAREDGSL